MSIQRLPNSNKNWIQSNVGDYRGNLYSTFNIDLDSEPGVIKPSKLLSEVIGSNELSNDHIQAIQVHDNYYYVATSGQVWRCSTDDDPTVTGNWAAISTFNTEDLGVESDMTSFDGQLLISTGTNIMSYDGTKDNDWWTAVAGGSALTALKTHTLDVLRTGVDTLFVTNGNTVSYYNSTAGVTTITLESLFNTHVLLPALDRMWVGTYTEVENNAYMYELQVGEDIATNAYPVDGIAVLSGFIYKNTPFVVTERGYIQVFNGAGFETIAQFPFANSSNLISGVRPGLIQDSPTARGIHPKGIKVQGKFAYIFVNMESEYTANQLVDERSFSGVWVLDLETFSLNHRYALPRGDRGWSILDRSGPLLLTNTPQTRIMVGGATNDGEEGLWVEGTSSFGWFVTARHESESVSDIFESFVIKADTLTTGESITLKAKTAQTTPAQLSVTWLNDKTFTTTDSVSSSAGDEIFILSGYKSGFSAHIVSIEGGATKTISIDESLGLLNETSIVRVENFRKYETAFGNSDGERKSFGSISGSHCFAQHKVEMSGDVTVREVISKSNNKEGL